MVYFNSKPIENWSIFSLIYKSCIPHFLSVYRRYITNWVVGQPQTRSFLLKWQFGDFVLEWFSPLSFESLNAEKALSVRNGPGSNNHLDFTKAQVVALSVAYQYSIFANPINIISVDMYSAQNVTMLACFHHQFVPFVYFFLPSLVINQIPKQSTYDLVTMLSLHIEDSLLQFARLEQNIETSTP